MKFSEVIDQASMLLQRKGRLTYRSLKREFDLDDDVLEDLKFELIEGQELAVDKDGKMLVWTGDEAPPPQPAVSQPKSQSPSTYTPQHLAERIRAEQRAMESRGSANGERKTITALFADLKGSTALIEGLDPEDARAIIDPALQLMMDAVHRYDGYVAQALGDGIFALFGAPVAHEDHPQRALYAALRMQEAMRGYADTLREEGGAPLQMRVGINTGEVVVRSIRKDDLHTDYVPVGHSTNLAARMEQLANPGSIVVTEQTHKLTDGYFNFQALGKTKVKGVEEPFPIYEVTGAGPLRTRLQVSARRGLTHFVGRHSEMEQLQEALEQAKAGHGQIVGVMGEPGLGKSRLFYEFKLTSQSGCLVLEAFSVSYGQASPYLPLIELLKDYFQIEPEDDERTRRQRIIGQVLELDRSLEDTLPYLFSLLGIEDSESSLQQMDAQIRRQRTFEALKKLFLRESMNQPTILIFEDLHWIDTETQGFLDALTDSVASAQLLLLTNCRPEYRHEWGSKTYYTQLRLAPLGHTEAEELLTFLLGNDESLKELKALILERTDGTPFFMEEVVQTLIEEGALQGERGRYQLETAPSELHISPTVQSVLAARIDRLTPEEKVLLQHLSVIGRQFPMSLVKHVVQQPETDLYHTLASLQAKEYLYEQPAFPESEYLFKHALTQDVAYSTILQEQRKALHEQTGHAIEALYQDTLEDHYNALAHHYAQSENAPKAVEYLHLAGQQAAKRSAHAEAEKHLIAALEFCEALPDTQERTRQELAIHTSLGPVRIVTQGYTTRELENTYLHAQTLSLQLGEPALLFRALWGLWLVYAVRNELQTAQQLGEQLLTQAQDSQDPLFFMPAYYALGWTAFWQGKVEAGCEMFEKAIALYDPQQHRQLGQIYGQHPVVTAYGEEAWALWFWGYPDRALTRSQEACSLAHQVEHPLSLSFVLAQAASLHKLRGEAPLTQDFAEAGLRVANEQGLSIWIAWDGFLQGWARAEQGQEEAGLAEMEQGWVDFQRTGTKNSVSWMLGHLAVRYGKVGRVNEGLRAVAEALTFVNDTEERFYEAELYRLRGELTLQQSKDIAEAEPCFHKAIAIAQHQQAKSLELRAATSLARLWQGQGKKREAHDLLAPVYNWFTEGFETADLKDAKALLDALGQR